MKSNKNSSLICFIISLFSLVICLYFHYLSNYSDAEFLVNVCLAIFGSALLGAITALVLYFNEKETKLELFNLQTRRLLKFINHYQTSMSLEEKMRFFLEYHDLDKDEWEITYSSLCFFKQEEQIDFIKTYIYQPIIEFNQAISQRVWNFRFYFDGSGKNEEAMEMFVNELEKHLIYVEENEVPIEENEINENNIQCEVISIESKLVRNVTKALNNGYICIMDNKWRKHKKNVE